MLGADVFTAAALPEKAAQHAVAACLGVPTERVVVIRDEAELTVAIAAAGWVLLRVHPDNGDFRTLLCLDRLKGTPDALDEAFDRVAFTRRLAIETYGAVMCEHPRNRGLNRYLVVYPDGSTWDVSADDDLMFDTGHAVIFGDWPPDYNEDDWLSGDVIGEDRR